MPSTHWRRRYSLLLGLERVLSEDEPRLADGTTLNPHQVDALSGTLTALLAEAQRDGDAPRRRSRRPVLAVDEEPEDEPSDDGEIDLEVDVDVDLDDDEEESDDASRRPTPTTTTSRPTRSTRTSPTALDDPNAHKRFWFEHATGAGKTVAAMGFVEASRTGGILILTHRRNLVDQFNGELRDARLRRPRVRRRCSTTTAAPTRRSTSARSRSRPTSGSSATPAASPTPTRSSSATRPTRRSARRPPRRSARGPARSSSA